MVTDSQRERAERKSQLVGRRRRRSGITPLFGIIAFAVSLPIQTLSFLYSTPSKRDLQDTILRHLSSGEDKETENVELATSVAAQSEEPNVMLKVLEDVQTEQTIPVCRVVASADSKLPTSPSSLPNHLSVETEFLYSLDSIYHAAAHEETRSLRYMTSEQTVQMSRTEDHVFVATTRKSLEDAGFQLLSSRDLDLCDALNSGYLLRLSIQPDLKKLSDSISREFYPELIGNGKPTDPESLLFGGRVLVYWRGYGKEVSKGRLLLPKIDYLQARLVQGAASGLKKWLDALERASAAKYAVTSRKVMRAIMRFLHVVIDKIPDEKLAAGARGLLFTNSTRRAKSLATNASSRRSTIKLNRYGGSRVRFVGSPDPSESLTPFVICDDESGTCTLGTDSVQSIFHGLDGDISDRDVDHDIYDSIKDADIKCQYDVDAEKSGRQTPPLQLLERITLGNLVDFESERGRGQLIKTLFAKSELVEPTYKEVVVVWRPLPERHRDLPPFTPPKFFYDVADMFDIAGLPPQEEDLPPPEIPRIQVRSFSDVPMANLPAVLPRTKLIFRPADAFVFDLVSGLSLLAVLGSLRFDSPKLDLIALLSVSFWLFRTFIRYSNKLARYDLLVKTFLTSKITHRNAGALKYIATQAGLQRATRAAIVHAWLCRRRKRISALEDTTARLIRDGERQVRGQISDDCQARVNMEAAIRDLEEVGLISKRNGFIEVVEEPEEKSSVLRRAWNRVFEGGFKRSYELEEENSESSDINGFD